MDAQEAAFATTMIQRAAAMLQQCSELMSDAVSFFNIRRQHAEGPSPLDQPRAPLPQNQPLPAPETMAQPLQQPAATPPTPSTPQEPVSSSSSTLSLPTGTPTRDTTAAKDKPTSPIPDASSTALVPLTKAAAIAAAPSTTARHSSKPLAKQTQMMTAPIWAAAAIAAKTNSATAPDASAPSPKQTTAPQKDASSASTTNVAAAHSPDADAPSPAVVVSSVPCVQPGLTKLQPGTSIPRKLDVSKPQPALTLVDRMLPKETSPSQRKPIVAPTSPNSSGPDSSVAPTRKWEHEKHQDRKEHAAIRQHLAENALDKDRAAVAAKRALERRERDLVETTRALERREREKQSLARADAERAERKLNKLFDGSPNHRHQREESTRAKQSTPPPHIRDVSREDRDGKQKQDKRAPRDDRRDTERRDDRRSTERRVDRGRIDRRNVSRDRSQDRERDREQRHRQHHDAADKALKRRTPTRAVEIPRSPSPKRPREDSPRHSSSPRRTRSPRSHTPSRQHTHSPARAASATEDTLIMDDHSSPSPRHRPPSHASSASTHSVAEELLEEAQAIASIADDSTTGDVEEFFSESMF